MHMIVLHFAITIAEIVRNMKPVRHRTGLIFCSFSAVVYI